MIDVASLLKTHALRVEEHFAQTLGSEDLPYLSAGVCYQFGSGGKRLRPAICLLTCEALRGDSNAAVPFALATELLHNFFLIHDDIEDGDTMRRDQPTLWAKLGVPNAINVSDLIIARAYRLILEAPLPQSARVLLARLFTFAFERTVEGQALDINLRGATEVNLATYLRIVELKTAYYLALTWIGGAVVAGTPEGALGPLWELGKCIGPAFQIRDDILDMTEGKGRGGEIGCDLKEGKPSIFFAFTLDQGTGTEAERRKLIEIVQKPREATSSQDVAWAIDFYRRTGAFDFAEHRARELIARSDEVIDGLTLDPGGKEVFRAIGRYMVDRMR